MHCFRIVTFTLGLWGMAVSAARHAEARDTVDVVNALAESCLLNLCTGPLKNTTNLKGSLLVYPPPPPSANRESQSNLSLVQQQPEEWAAGRIILSTEMILFVLAILALVCTVGEDSNF
ncbi:hypothetical protein FB45DRAFT_933836 [Roridomyces roridus]|uniref:Uncharacterized protein n=1 Tax=Roridomyces roridus TaxID=1738132 RepID=A0AAD7BDB8_9AGAR|nr:hypothetical protein FB45DRAFT_933836 [Roridomyces roridus]